MTSSSRPSARRLAGLLTALATLLVLGGLAPSSALADELTGYAISGTVTDDTGAPAEGIAVTVSPNGLGRPATTDAAGHYSVPNLLPGSYAVTFTPPAGSALLGETYDDAPQWTPTRVTVGSADVTGIDAALDRAATITGRTVDADGNPIPGVGVQLQSAAFTYTTATTGEDGTFTAAGLRPSDWRISFTAPSGSGWVSEYYDDVLTWEAQTAVPVAPGATVTLNDAVLAHGNTITGRILGPDGTPRAGVEVFAGSNESNGAGATTDADGIYTIVGLADGDYTVYAQPDWAGNLLAVVYPGSWDWDDAQDVHVSGAETRALGDMTMVQGGAISGTVTGSDGAPVANANVRAASGDAENGATTQSDGSYSINLLPPGSYRVSASGYNPAIVRTYYAATPGETRASQATPVVLATGGAVGDIAIHASPRGTAPATIVATAAHPPVLGEPFTIDVAVSGGQGVPTGSVWVGNTIATEVNFADADLDATGHATLTFEATDQGTYPWIEVWYVGDATYAGGTVSVDYVPGGAAPSITALAPASGTVLGGEQVTVTGTGFGPDSTVTFGGVAAAAAVHGPDSLVATAPAHAAGPVDVVVTTQGQASAPVSYTYEKVATSLALTGPSSATPVGTAAAFTATVTGSAATPTGSVTFAVDGGAPVSVPLVGGSAVLSTSTLAVGAHSVVATFAGDDTYGASSAQVAHTVSAPVGTLPVVERALPNVGLSTGGTLTVVTGKNFVKGRTTVSFGTVTTSKVTVLSSTALVVVVPKHEAGAVRVTVTTPAGRSTTSARFTYVAPPVRAGR
ncbi:hypothetical protein ASE38_08350 [Cellulomonas sp. Root930]|nr:hypothetical protein ASE38_08350 [Cellulomonas sp. Root930]